MIYPNAYKITGSYINKAGNKVNDVRNVHERTLYSAKKLYKSFLTNKLKYKKVKVISGKKI